MVSSLKIGLSNSIDYFDLEKVFKIASELKLDGVEILPFRWMTAKFIQKLVNKYQIPVLGVHGPWWMSQTSWWWIFQGRRTLNRNRQISPTKFLFEKFVDETAQTIFWKLIMGSWETCRAKELARVFPNAYLNLHADLAWELQNSSIDLRIFRQLFPNITIENVDTEHRMVPPGIETQIEMTKRFGCCATLDTTHVGYCLNKYGHPGLMESYRKIKSSGAIRVIHFSDFDPDQNSGLKKGHNIPGDGILPLQQFLGQLKKDEFDDTIIIELFPENDYRTAKDKVERSLKFIKENFK